MSPSSGRMGKLNMVISLSYATTHDGLHSAVGFVARQPPLNLLLKWISHQFGSFCARADGFAVI